MTGVAKEAKAWQPWLVVCVFSNLPSQPVEAGWRRSPMKPLPLFFTIALLLGAAAFAADKKPGKDESKKVPKGDEVLVVADSLSSVPETFRPSPGNPVYYVFSGKTEHDLGTVVAGIPMPPPDSIEQEVEKALGSQGFVRTKVGGPMPSICILIVWGAANFFDYGDGEKFNRRDVADMESISGVRKAVGFSNAPPPAAGFDPIVLPPDQQKVIDTANDDRLYVSVVALDAGALFERRVRMLWRTNISIDWRNNLADALPVMLASAAPMFGLSAKEPVFVDDKARRNAQVDIGELKVVPDQPPAGSEPKK